MIQMLNDIRTAVDGLTEKQEDDLKPCADRLPVLFTAQSTPSRCGLDPSAYFNADANDSHRILQTLSSAAESFAVIIYFV